MTELLVVSFGLGGPFHWSSRLVRDAIPLLLVQVTAFSVLNVPGHTHRYQCLAAIPMDAPTRLTEICAWFQLHNTELSLAISCQLAWYAPALSTTPQYRATY